jgi:threonine dehydratase
LEDIERAAAAGLGVVRVTPVLSTRTLSERAGGTIALKAENLQRTGSFKLRGALAKIASLGDACSHGVVTGSAGNHGQAVAYAARTVGVPCEVFMPEGAPIAKAEAAAALGATVRYTGMNVDEALTAARERAATGGLTFVHPFDDPVVIAGQGGLGLELLEQVPDIARVIVRRRWTNQRHRDRAQVAPVRHRGDRRSGRHLRPVSGLAGSREPGSGDLGPDDRRRDRGQAPG